MFGRRYKVKRMLKRGKHSSRINSYLVFLGRVLAPRIIGSGKMMRAKSVRMLRMPMVKS